MKKNTPPAVCVCPYCLQAIQSHGEKVVILEHEYAETVCEFCDEETDEVLKIRYK